MAPDFTETPRSYAGCGSYLLGSCSCRLFGAWQWARAGEVSVNGREHCGPAPTGTAVPTCWPRTEISQAGKDGEWTTARLPPPRRQRAPREMSRPQSGEQTPARSARQETDAGRQAGRHSGRLTQPDSRRSEELGPMNTKSAKGRGRPKKQQADFISHGV